MKFVRDQTRHSWDFRGSPVTCRASDVLKYATGFCKNCVTPLPCQGQQWAGEAHFLIGTFGEPRRFAPTGDVFRKEVLDWCPEEK